MANRPYLVDSDVLINVPFKERFAELKETLAEQFAEAEEPGALTQSRLGTDLVVANIHEARSLAQTRDLLLPKLMSGEIRLRDAEKAVEAVA